MDHFDNALLPRMAVLVASCCIAATLPSSLEAQAPPVDVSAAGLVVSITDLGTPSSLIVTNRGKVAGGPYIVYVAGRVPSVSNGSYCVKVRLVSAYPYTTDVSVRGSNGIYQPLYPPTATTAGNLVTVVVHASGGDFLDTMSYRMTSKGQLSDSEATSLGTHLQYVLSAPCS